MMSAALRSHFSWGQYDRKVVREKELDLQDTDFIRSRFKREQTTQIKGNRKELRFKEASEEEEEGGAPATAPEQLRENCGRQVSTVCIGTQTNPTSSNLHRDCVSPSVIEGLSILSLEAPWCRILVM